MNHYDLIKTDGHPNVIRYYTLTAMKECGLLDHEIRCYANTDINNKEFLNKTEDILSRCNKIYDKKCEDECRSQKYRQTAVSKQADVLYNLRTLADWCVEEEAYKAIKNAIKLIDKIDSTAFAEDNNGNRIEWLIPACKPDWKK